MRINTILSLSLLAACGETTDGTSTTTTSNTTTSTSATTDIDCSDRPFEYATPRGEVSGVWDKGNQRFIVFGGDMGVPEECYSQTEFVGDTWAFHPDCDNFAELTTEVGPAPRGRHVAILDDANNRMLLHGGRYRAGTSGNYLLFDDLWAFDFAADTWTEVSSTGGPDGRVSHVAEVTAGGKLLVYGGNESTDGYVYAPLEDLWEFDLKSKTWTELASSNDPGDRIFSASTMSEDGDIMYLFGGIADYVGPFYSDLWALDVKTYQWTKLADDQSNPAPRMGANMVLDKNNNRLIIWAGHDDTNLGNTNQVWAFDLATNSWSQEEPGDLLSGEAKGFCDFPSDFTDPDLAAPERRYLGSAAATDTGQMIVFGGKTDCGIIDDVWTWSFSGQGWVEHSSASTGEVCLRAYASCSSLCY